MKKSWLVAGAIVLVGVLVWWINRPEPLLVDIIRVERGVVERSVANTRVGTVEACQRGKLSLPIGGQIENIYVQEGDRVEAGAPLVSLWNADRAAQVSLAEAQLLAATRDEESSCVAAASDEREAARLERLSQQQLVSSEAVEQRRSQADASRLNCEATGARRAQADASLSLAQAQLELTVLKAPFAGQVAELNGEVGEYATPSPPGIATLPTVDLLTNDCHYVAAPLDEIDAAGVNPGMPVRITMDAFGESEFSGRVSRIAPFVQDYERQARTVEIRVDFDSVDDTRLLAGYSADVEVILETRDNVMRIPSEYVIEGNKVMVLDDGVLQMQEFEPGISSWRYTQVLSGLDDSTRIVSSVGDAGVVVGAAATERP